MEELTDKQLEIITAQIDSINWMNAEQRQENLEYSIRFWTQMLNIEFTSSGFITPTIKKF